MDELNRKGAEINKGSQSAQETKPKGNTVQIKVHSFIKTKKERKN